MSTRRRTPVQKALIELRRRLNDTQQSFAERLGITLPTVGAWETTEPPKNIALANLEWIANGLDRPGAAAHPDLAAVFHDALEELKGTQARKMIDILDEIERWHKIKAHLTQLGQIDAAVRAATNVKDAKAAVEPMYDELVAFEKVLAAAQKWSWRN